MATRTISNDYDENCSFCLCKSKTMSARWTNKDFCFKCSILTCAKCNNLWNNTNRFCVHCGMASTPIQEHRPISLGTTESFINSSTTLGSTTTSLKMAVPDDLSSLIINNLTHLKIKSDKKSKKNIVEPQLWVGPDDSSIP